MRLNAPNSGWIDCCENCLDRIFRAYDGEWIGIAEDSEAIRNLRCDNGRHHVPIGIDPPRGASCPHGHQWWHCCQGCIGLDGEYIPLHGHEPLYKQEYPTTEVVRCCHCGNPIKPSTWREKRWFRPTRMDPEAGSHRCDKAPNGFHEPQPFLAATTNDQVRPRKTEADA